MKKNNFKVWLSLGLFVLLLLFYTQGIHKWITIPSTLASILLDMLVFLALAYIFYLVLESYLQAPTRQIESKLGRLDLVQVLEKSLIPSMPPLRYHKSQNFRPIQRRKRKKIKNSQKNTHMKNIFNFNK